MTKIRKKVILGPLRNNAPATLPPPPQGEIAKTILERVRENTNQMNARIDQILLLPTWKTCSEPQKELGIPKMTS